VQDACFTIGARWGHAARGRSYRLGILYKLMAALLTLMALFAPGVAVPDGFGRAA
jgi:hypothetical protein